MLAAWAFDDEAEPGDYWVETVPVGAFRPQMLSSGEVPSRNTERVRDLLLARHVH